MPTSPANQDVTPKGGGYEPCRPELPAGYHAQQAWGFRDTDAGFYYEFNRVYGPPDEADPRGPIARLHQNLSYWSVMWPVTGATGDEHPAGRWMTYGQARQRRSRHLTFADFSSPEGMRGELPELFRDQGTE
jgi:hypothetical protein